MSTPPRYRRLGERRPDFALAIDEATGALVFLPEDARRGEPRFLHTARARRAARALAALEDRRFAPIPSLAPVAISARRWSIDGGVLRQAAHPRDLSDADAVAVGIEALELAAIAWRCGESLSMEHVAVVPDDRGWRVHAIAPLGRDAYRAHDWLFAVLSFLHRLLGAGPARAVVETWRAKDDRFRPQVIDALELLTALAAMAGPSARVSECRSALEVARWPAAPMGTDLDEVIELGRLDRPEPDEDHEWWKVVHRFRLGAYTHRRACLQAAAGRLELAIADARAAWEVDRHPELGTTLALFLERAGEHDEARARHDAAVAAIAMVAPVGRRSLGSDFQAIVDRGADVRTTLPKKVARTFLSRGVFRLRHGDVRGARADLQASLAAHDTPEARRALARCTR